MRLLGLRQRWRVSRVAVAPAIRRIDDVRDPSRLFPTVAAAIGGEYCVRRSSFTKTTSSFHAKDCKECSRVLHILHVEFLTLNF